MAFILEAMRLRRYVPRITVGLTTLIAGALCYSYGAYYGGRFEASVDLMRSRYSIRVYGPQRGDDALYEQILASEYDIEVVTVAGCMVSEQLKEKTRAYNDVMEAAIEKRYGQEITEKLWLRAQSEYELTP